ncbi:JmjC domain-containing protein [Streptomyces sp. NPDC059582]|uniref:JmjC domain-containing protein n=1 Tax=Streptomyces sp. NPDC059582 TaxID=3346875 RepID=UPI0036BD1D0A
MDGLGQFASDADAFINEHWRKTPTIFHPSSAPVDLLSVEDAWDILKGGLLRVPYIRLLGSAGPIPEERYCVPRIVSGEPLYGYADETAVRELLRAEQATLLLRYVDQWHAGVRALTSSVAERTGRLTEAFFFHTQPGVQSPAHRDDGDALVIQIDGQKRWKIYGAPTDPQWVPGRKVDTPGPVLLDTIVKPGDVLYIPHGFAHHAEAAGDASSSHLTVTMREAAAPHLRATLQSLLTDGCSLPGRPLGDEALIDTARRLLDHMKMRLADTTPQQVIEHARPHAHANRLW